MSTPRNVPRRTILRGAAGAALALPWLASLAPRTARAATAPIKRFIVMFSPNGTLPGAWTPTGTETSFTLGPILAPLAPHQADLVVVAGLNQQGGGGDGHQNGMGGMLTGTGLNPGPFAGQGAAPAGWAMGPSVDQRIAAAMNAPTKYRSLELGVQVNAADNWGRMIYRTANQPLPPNDDPADVYARVFTDLHTDPADAGPAAQTQEVDPGRRRRRIRPRLRAAGRRRSHAPGRARDGGARD